ncbi:precorrin-6y C5,15-methyltransferase (decarboxylating) subunit CbiE [Heliorestis acidaminivorans]|uniref:Precorrin-6y C5,15-methyltransferase (Decarboxylating) subunit CbiE n=1 Tax=Heliorestis acidaminivorans TaxID=553427 RepID=A0A6I0EWL4_9FIRM|nr:precorrin-6y C5,15-methyltransferase (decarboxylating) subunit CbiE [Heliorestis acidaminivorans]KAB2954179.1 precorrin-6y C5,15-methyltransferase (decarboxylating) subunit CbiE [Heliorestis acidaminivorans]
MALENLITVIGIGPGTREYLTEQAIREVENAQVLVGGKRALALFAELKKPQRLIDADLEGLINFLEAEKGKKKIALLVSGDPGFYSLLPLLSRRLGVEQLKVIPGLSSLQLAFAKIKQSWQECRWQSLHGRNIEDMPLHLDHSGWVAYLTDPQNGPEKLCQHLTAQGEGWREGIILYNLGYEKEEVQTGSLEELASQVRSPYEPALLMVRGGRVDKEKESATMEAERFYPGLPDQAFIRKSTPMTKSDVRALTLLRAGIQRKDIVWDVGAGTGSISIEAAQLADQGQVYAIERNAEASSLIQANQEHFRVNNLTVIYEEAPAGLQELPDPDVVIIGGSGGNLKAILSESWQKLKQKGRIVINAITVETVAETTAWLEEQKIPFQAVQVQIQKMEKAGSYHLWKSLNPVTILWASKEEN